MDQDIVLAFGTGLPLEDLLELRELGQIGHVRAIQEKLSDIETRQPETAAVTAKLRLLVSRFELGDYDAVLEVLQREHAD
jgi:hypothetical protein